ncbi:MAG: Ig-like domain repeat protein, partial [Nitrosotalea sp.]
MNKILISMILVMFSFLVSFTTHNAAATDFVISNDASGQSTCTVLHGDWNDGNGTAICTINTNILLNQTDSLTIESDTTLVNMANISDSAPIVNLGTIVNSGQFIVAGTSTETSQGGTITNFGTIKNEKDFSSTGAFGAVSNEGTGIITNEGVFKIDNFLDNSGGVVLNQQESVLVNKGIIKIDGGTFDNEGTFTNTGLLTLPSEISNSILLNNTRAVTVNSNTILSQNAVLLIGHGTILSINAGVSLTNSGNITNTNLISNFGTINNKNILKNVGTLEDNCGSNFTNTSTLKGNAPVPECPSVISLTPSMSPVPSNSSLKLTALVADANGYDTKPTGSVTFDDSNAGGIFGSISCSTKINDSLVCNTTYTTPYTPKTITVAANYGGDFVHKPKLAQTSLTVKSSTTETISASANPSVSGQYVVFTSTVSPITATGTVQFQVDGTDVGAPVVLSGGQAIWSASSLSVGLHVVTAVYSGDSDSFGGTAITTQTINQDNVVTMISSSQNPSISSQQVTLTTIVNAQYPGSGVPTGDVVFYDNEVDIGTEPLIGNTASLSTGLSGGTHIITAAYSGDSNFVIGRSAKLMQLVSQVSNIMLSSSQNPSLLNQQVELLAIVSTPSQSSVIPTGSV